MGSQTSAGVFGFAEHQTTVLVCDARAAFVALLGFLMVSLCIPLLSCSRAARPCGQKPARFAHDTKCAFE